jgi:hypothetical protein
MFWICPPSVNPCPFYVVIPSMREHKELWGNTVPRSQSSHWISGRTGLIAAFLGTLSQVAPHFLMLSLVPL